MGRVLHSPHLLRWWLALEAPSDAQEFVVRQVVVAHRGELPMKGLFFLRAQLCISRGVIGSFVESLTAASRFRVVALLTFRGVFSAFLAVPTSTTKQPVHYGPLSYMPGNIPWQEYYIIEIYKM